MWLSTYHPWTRGDISRFWGISGFVELPPKKSGWESKCGEGNCPMKTGYTQWELPFGEKTLEYPERGHRSLAGNLNRSYGSKERCKLQNTHSVYLMPNILPFWQGFHTMIHSCGPAQSIMSAFYFLKRCGIAIRPLAKLLPGNDLLLKCTLNSNPLFS